MSTKAFDPHTKAQPGDTGSRAATSATILASIRLLKSVRRVADCIQAMGANGLRAEYPLARHLTCAKIAAYTDGSIEMMNERIGVALPQVLG